MRTRANRAGLIVLVLVIAGCGGSDIITGRTLPTDPAANPVTTRPITTRPITTRPITTRPITTSPVTTSPVTTSPVTTSPVTTSPVTTSPVTTSPVTNALPDTYVVAEDTDLVEIATAGDRFLRIVEEFFNGDGVFRSFIRLSPDRTWIYFSEGYEDAWYGCESSVGAVGRIAVATGELERLARGSRIELSPDGAKTVHLDSGVCVPDPEAPDLWVFTPYDRVVVTDVASGSNTEYLTDNPPASYEAPSAIDWAGLAADGSVMVLTADGTLRRVPPGATGAIQDQPVVLTGFTAFPMEFHDNVLYAIEFGDEGSADLVATDLDTGTTTQLASSEASMTLGVGPQGQLIATAFAPITVEPGVDLTVVMPPSDEVVYYEIDW